MVKKAKETLIRAGIFFLQILFFLLPLGVFLSFARTLGGVLGRLFRKDRKVSETQLTLARDYLKIDISPRRVALENFAHLGEAVAEVLSIKKLLKEDSSKQIDSPLPNFRYIKTIGEHHILDIKRRDQGSIILSAHIGCFELLAAWASRVGVQLSVVARMPNYPELVHVIEGFRQDYGVPTLWREDKNSGTKILRVIRNGETLAGLIDQDVDLINGFADFFGLPAASPIAPIRIAIRYNLPLYSAFIVREAHLKHTIHIKQIDYTVFKENIETSVVAVYNKQLEALIAKHPEQWLWWHRRWRRRPDVDYAAHPEKLMSTKEYLRWLQRIIDSQSL